ncbi:MAG: hypothetical protein KTR18_07375 [Acidiferrobacterales bacterium]|nr:hypothetical protein [Acidiferrobacterales bacterium]
MRSTCKPRTQAFLLCRLSRVIQGALALLVLTSGAAFSSDSRESLASLQERAIEFRQKQLSGENPLPFLLSSSFTSTLSRAKVRTFIRGVELDTFSSKLLQPAQWCEFIPLHLNIKACGHLVRNQKNLVQFYAGVKGYVTPDDAHLLQLSFDARKENGVFFADLFAADGPLDSTNIRFNIHAIGAEGEDGKGVYVEFALSSEPGLTNSLARVYLATIARRKIGFSIKGKTWSGKPKYVGGQRGAIERNLVRYLLAIDTFFETESRAGELDENALYELRVQRWYDKTDQYREQLFELSREEYISNKMRERQNQQVLQEALDNNLEPVYKLVDERR